jgi:enoyl-CoA hydratase/carnithine racemase
MIRFDDDAGVRTITLDRPEARNALTSDAFASLDRTLRETTGDDGIGAVIVTGAGREAFCAGQDLKEIPEIDPLALGSHPFHAFIETLNGFPKPLVAAVRGVAVGAGVTMLPYFDFVVAATDARFHTPFVELGVPTEGGSSLMLPATVGPRLAARMLLLAEWITAGDALAAGLVSAVVEGDDVVPRATELARRLLALPASAVTATKRLLVEARRDAVSAAFARERAAGLDLYTAPAFRARLAEFGRSGRPPVP